MIAAHSNPSVTPQGPEKAITLALRLVEAEKAIHEYTSGQVDAIVDLQGRPYLLRPTQELLRESESRQGILLDSIGDGITVVDRSGSVNSQNRAAIRMLGYSTEELVGLKFFDFVAPEGLGRFHAAFFNVIEEFHVDALVEFNLLARDGSCPPMEGTVSKLRDSASASIVLTCRDVTRRSTSEETTASREGALSSETRSNDHSLAMHSSELLNPLLEMSLGVKMLLEDERFNEVRPTLTMIFRNVKLLQELSSSTSMKI